jgi:hypothetical protein
MTEDETASVIRGARHEDLAHSVLIRGNERANRIADVTLDEVRIAMGTPRTRGKLSGLS